MIWIVRRTDQGGGYLQPPGSKNSYGPARTARRFRSEREAADECCDNETPEAL